MEEVAKACQSSAQVAAKGGPHDNAHVVRARRRGGAAGPDADDPGPVAGGKLLARQKHEEWSRRVSLESKRPASSSNASKGLSLIHI